MEDCSCFHCLVRVMSACNNPGNEVPLPSTPPGSPAPWHQIETPSWVELGTPEPMSPLRSIANQYRPDSPPWARVQRPSPLPPPRSPTPPPSKSPTPPPTNEQHITDVLKQNGSLIVYSVLTAYFKRVQNEEEVVIPIPFTAKSSSIFLTTPLEEWFDVIMKQPILKNVEEFYAKRSN
ncbi:uncharacterized protein LOC127287547 [Leptopilina boulardi]|uniref:uncharacterized protein LOC127287547 n=1 Tax=Leptopilina boulardi TaxID=63433 RepID=UPI0021F68B99|nr:uncharacterized protein LOC127287547 [Leptopilina boulardi]